MAPTWPIPETLRAEIRRVLGYPDLLSQASIQLGYPNYASEMQIFQPYAVLENKLAFMESAIDEAIPVFGALHPYFGAFYNVGSYGFEVTTPTAIANGASITAAIGGNPGVTVTAGPGATPATMATALANALNADAASSALVTTAAATSVAPATVTSLALAQGKNGNGIAVSLLVSDASIVLTDNLGRTGRLLSGATSAGSDPPGPWIPVESDNVAELFPLYGYLPIIFALEGDLGFERRNLSAAATEAVKLRPNVLATRDSLLRRYRRELADRFSIPLDPDIAGNRRRSRTRFV